MKCLFFCQSEGFGHRAQALALKPILESMGIEVAAIYLTKNDNSKQNDWVTKSLNAPCFSYYSPNFIYKNNKVDLLQTVVATIKNVKKISESVKYVKQGVAKYKPEFIINFYEPVLALSGIGKKIPVITIGHQFMIDHPSYPKDLPFKKLFLSLFNKLISWHSSKILALSYYPEKDYKNIKVSPPLIRDSILAANSATVFNKVVCYVLNPNLAQKIIDQAPLYPNHSFLIYNNEFCFKRDNVECRKTGPEFVTDLMSAHFVICSGGFETVCESIVLSKKILAVPIENHAEQMLNVIDASRKGLIITNDNYDVSKLLDDKIELSQQPSAQFIRSGPEFYKNQFQIK